MEQVLVSKEGYEKYVASCGCTFEHTFDLESGADSGAYLVGEPVCEYHKQEDKWRWVQDCETGEFTKISKEDYEALFDEDN